MLSELNKQKVINDDFQVTIQNEITGKLLHYKVLEVE